MFGLFLVFSSTLFKEISSTIGKYQIAEKRSTIFTFGFLEIFWGTIAYFAIAFLIRQEFIFSLDSLPTFGLRLVLEVVQAHVTVLALARASRSTFTFLRTLTIPLLLVTDMFLGYSLGTVQIVGVLLILCALISLFYGNRRIDRAGAGLVLFTAVNSVATLSLYKYNISHFNSVEAEQGLIALAVLTYFFIAGYIYNKENPFRFLRQRTFFMQSISSGLGSVILAYSYTLAAASIITTAKRASEILWALVSGQYYFAEKNLTQKILAFLVVGAGLVLLTL